MTYQLESGYVCIRHGWSVYEQNNTVNSVHADDRTAELATIAGNEIVYDA